MKRGGDAAGIAMLDRLAPQSYAASPLVTLFGPMLANDMAKRIRPRPTESERREETGFYDAYAGFARTIRLWFIAYGVGGPAAFLTNESANRRLASSNQGWIVAYAFLAGVVLQIALAMIYKAAMWYLYLAEYDEQVKTLKRYKYSHWFSEAYWIEVLGDIATLVLFGGATFVLIRIFFM